MNIAVDQNPIRVATEDDIERWLPVARIRYPGRDINAGIPWVRWCMQRPDRLALTGLHSCGIAEIVPRYGFEPRAVLSLLLSDGHAGFEPLRIVRQMVVWAKVKGVSGHFIIDADTGVDFGPLARRMGGGPADIKRYKIPL